jgi:hypothetical protein
MTFIPTVYGVPTLGARRDPLSAGIGGDDDGRQRLQQRAETGMPTE